MFFTCLKGSRAFQGGKSCSSTYHSNGKEESHPFFIQHHHHASPSSTPHQDMAYYPHRGRTHARAHTQTPMPLPCTRASTFSSGAYVRNFLLSCMEMGPLCSVVPVVAKSRLVLERDGLLHMPRWELVFMHVLSLLSNLIIWHIHYEPRFFFRCGLEDSANSCTCTTRGTKKASFCRSSVHIVFLWAKRNRTRSCCLLPVQRYSMTAMSVVPAHIQFCTPTTLLILVLT